MGGKAVVAPKIVRIEWYNHWPFARDTLGHWETPSSVTLEMPWLRNQAKEVPLCLPAPLGSGNLRESPQRFRTQRQQPCDLRVPQFPPLFPLILRSGWFLLRLLCPSVESGGSPGGGFFINNPGQKL